MIHVARTRMRKNGTLADGSVRRLVSDTRGKDYAVTLAPEGAWIRLKGKRTAYLMPYGHMFLNAAKMAADEIRAARPRKRKAARGLLRG